MKLIPTSASEATPEHDPLVALAKVVRRSTALLWAAVALLAFTLALLLSGCTGDVEPEAESAQSPAAATQSAPQFSNFQAANLVIGHNVFDLGIPDNGTTGMSIPFGRPAIGGGGKLFVPDNGNNRVMVFNTFPTANGAAASFAIGQPDLLSGPTGGTSATQLDRPTYAQVHNGKLLVRDGSRRLLIYNQLPVADNPAADVVVGQATMTANVSGCSASTLNNNTIQLGGFFAVGNRLILADRANNRVLIYKPIPTTSGAAPNLVLGQGNFNTCASNDDDQDGDEDTVPPDANRATARTLSLPQDIWSDGTRLVITDFGNSRVLIWNTFPTTSFAPADVVLGQSDFNHVVDNDDDQNHTPDGVPTARTFRGVHGVTSNGTQLFVADSQNNRVLIWNTFPTANFTPADVVLGQSDFEHDTPNDPEQDGTESNWSGQTFSQPTAVFLRGSKQLVVTDASNSRLLVFKGQ